jgi:hypothetical protein
MIVRHRLAYTAVFCLLWAFSAVGQTSPTLTFERHARSGVASPIGTQLSFRGNTCAQFGQVEITLIEQPKNGTIIIRDETLQIPKSTLYGDTGACAGQPTFGKHIYGNYPVDVPRPMM